MDAATIKQMIENQLEDAMVDVQGDDGVHFEATIISPAFEGLSPIKRHRLVYAALGDAMQQAIHALSITAKTPSEATA